MITFSNAQYIENQAYLQGTLNSTNDLHHLTVILDYSYLTFSNMKLFIKNKEENEENCATKLFG